MSARKGAMVGFGFIAEKRHLPAYRERKELEIRRRGGRVRRAARPPRRARCPTRASTRTHRALLAAEGSKLDFLDVDRAPLPLTRPSRARRSSAASTSCARSRSRRRGRTRAR